MRTDIRLSKEELETTKQDALELFFSGIKSKETKRTMTANLKTFLINACADLVEGDFEQRAQQFVKIAIEDQEKATRIILAYVKRLKERSNLSKTDSYYLNPSTIPNKIKPIRKLLDMNNVGLAWKRVYSTYPELDNTHKGRGYSREEIKKFLEYSPDVEIDFVILASSSGGLRVGAWEGLTWEDTFPIYKSKKGFTSEPIDSNDKIVCGALRIYGGTPEEYIALVSIETWEKLSEYKKFYAKKIGRMPKNSDCLLLERFSKVTPMSLLALRKRLERIAARSGIRQPLLEGRRRYEVPATHGFRRFWNKVMMNAQRRRSTLAALVIKERLMGHGGLVNTDKNYFWTEVSDLVPEYLEAMPELIINDEIRLRLELENKNNELEINQQKIDQTKEMAEKLKELEAKVLRMTKYEQSS
ncbi:MAG: integrase [Candidatus Nitrosopumilus sp. bin_68KS]